MQRPSTPLAIALVLPLLLAVAVAAIAITVRARGLDGTVPAAPDTSPLAVAPVDAPQAQSPQCTALLASLDGDLPAGDRVLPRRALVTPSPPGVLAWAATPQPVVLRCGVPRPAELVPTAALLEINGVRWLSLDDGPPPNVLTYVAVDRPVFVALTLPIGVGSGPVQRVSDVLRTQLPATPVAVR